MMEDQDNTIQALLILIANPKLEEMLVDFLLQQSDLSGFTSMPVSGHGGGHDTTKLSLVEQVSGRQRRVQFMLHAALPVLRELIAALKAEFMHADMHYMLLPVLEAQSL